MVRYRRQFTSFHSSLQAVDNRPLSLFVYPGQLCMDRITMRANLRAEIAEKAPIAKVSLLEKVELNGKVSAEGETRTPMARAATPSRWCVYQFHHFGVNAKTQKTCREHRGVPAKHNRFYIFESI